MLRRSGQRKWLRRGVSRATSTATSLQRRCVRRADRTEDQIVRDDLGGVQERNRIAAFQTSFDDDLLEEIRRDALSTEGR